MKKIILKFLTRKGEEAYYKIEEEGKNQPWKDRKIAEKVCTDKVISKNPLIVETKIKIDWLAVQIQLDDKMIEGLQMFGAVKDIDYTMNIE